jgi:hypothetical protein
MLPCAGTRRGLDQCIANWLGRRARAPKIELLKRTANSNRHARLKFDPPPNPMERTEARSLLAKPIARAFDEAPATPPTAPSKERWQLQRPVTRPERAAFEIWLREGHC